MNKDFDEEELAAIMSEIDSLEAEFSSREDDISSEQRDFDSKHDDVIMKQLVEEIELISPGPALEKPAAEDIISLPKAKSTNHMSFQLEGDMKLNLNFKLGGKIVDLHITEDSFEIEVDGGVKFSVPVSSQTNLEKAA